MNPAKKDSAFLKAAAVICCWVPWAGFADFAVWVKAALPEKLSGYVINAGKNSGYNRYMNVRKKSCIPAQKTDRFWRKCMKLGGCTGCHQMPERSFFIKDYQFPVCARCTGVIFGYLIAVPMFLFLGSRVLFSLLGCFVMLADWSLQALKRKTSTNPRRFLTGILGGYGIMTLQLSLMKKLPIIRNYFQ